MWNIVLVHTVHPRHRGPPCERLFELPKRLLRPFRNHFNRAVGQVAADSLELEPLRHLPDKPPEADALHSAVNHEARRRHRSYSWPRCATRRRCHRTYTTAITTSTGSRINTARPA